MECMLQASMCQAFGTDCNDLVSIIQDPKAWFMFSTELKKLIKLKNMFSTVFIPLTENVLSDTLVNIFS